MTTLLTKYIKIIYLYITYNIKKQDAEMRIIISP